MAPAPCTDHPHAPTWAAVVFLAIQRPCCDGSRQCAGYFALSTAGSCRSWGVRTCWFLQLLQWGSNFWLRARPQDWGSITQEHSQQHHPLTPRTRPQTQLPFEGSLNPGFWEEISIKTGLEVHWEFTGPNFPFISAMLCHDLPGMR